MSWDIGDGQEFQVHITVLCNDRKGLLRDISQVISKNETNIKMVEFKMDDSYVKGNLSIEVKDLHHLTRVMHSIRKVSGIISVDRVEHFSITDFNS